MNLVLSIVGLIFLLAPTIVEVIRDRKGDAHPNSDWKSRTVLCVIAGFIVGLMMPIPGIFFWSHLKNTVVSGCLFIGVFNYWINYIHIKNDVVEPAVNIARNYSDLSRRGIFMHVVSHLSKTAWPDKTKWWRALGWKGRLVVNALILIGGLILYFI